MNKIGSIILAICLIGIIALFVATPNILYFKAFNNNGINETYAYGTFKDAETMLYKALEDPKVKWIGESSLYVLKEAKDNFIFNKFEILVNGVKMKLHFNDYIKYRKLLKEEYKKRSVLDNIDANPPWEE